MERDTKEKEEIIMNRRLKTTIQQQHLGDNNINNNSQNPQPQKCPRCESLNTKFCYFNNYSLSQPRYFCKTCRRYWTQGGTLRNVPVGGGCRKGKRMKTSSNSAGEISNSRSQTPQQLNLGLNSAANISAAVFKESESHLISSSSSFYPGGGFLNDLAAIQSLSNQTVPQSFPLTPIGGGSATSNLNLLHGFNAIAPSFGSHQQQQRPFYPPQPQQNWQQSFINGVNIINPSIPDTALWSISTSTTSANNNINNNTAATAASASASASASFRLNDPSDHQWHEHDLSGYGPP